MTEQEYRDQLGITQIRYLGDSVYAGIRGGWPVIWTDNGLGPNGDIICLEECQNALVNWLDDIKGAAS